MANAGSRRVQKCSATLYCGRECQKKAWPLHKATSRLYEQFEGDSDSYKSFNESKEWYGLSKNFNIEIA